MPKSREARQDDALVLLLQALPPERLERILAEVAPRRTELVAPARDNRYCTICGKRYPLCRAAFADDHEFGAPPSRPRHHDDDEPVERGAVEHE